MEEEFGQEEELDQWERLLLEAPFVQKVRAEDAAKLAEKVAEVEAKAAIELLQQRLVAFVEGRFPPLTVLAQQNVTKIQEPARLRMLAKQVAGVPDEATAGQVLTTLTM